MQSSNPELNPLAPETDRDSKDIPSSSASGNTPQSSGRSSQEHQDRVIAALREANRLVYEAARAGLRNRGMGCTAEVVVIDGSQVVIGHVGDSRTYHLHRSRLTQISRDQTFVNRLVELGQLSEKEAETHPRRSELQQAIGGRSEVLPETYLLTLQSGDWILVCSDGLTNQLAPQSIEAILCESGSAERAARRLVNLANLDGSTDNVTVIVVRRSLIATCPDNQIAGFPLPSLPRDDNSARNDKRSTHPVLPGHGFAQNNCG